VVNNPWPVDVAKLPGPHMVLFGVKDRFFFINRVAPSQVFRSEPVRLPEEITVFPPVKKQVQLVRFRFPFQNNIVFKMVMIEDGKPVAFPFPPVE
jgi:hypothetical protein